MKDENLGLIAGSGDFPILVADAAKAQGVQRVVAVGFRSQTDPSLARHVDQLHYVGIGQLGKLIGLFHKADVRVAVMAGKIQHKVIFTDIRFDLKMLGLIARLKDRRADTILGGIAQTMEKEGIPLIASTRYLTEDLAQEGALTRCVPSPQQWKDIDFGRSIALELARLDIGQSVAVKDQAVVAVEGLEGTDEMILRAGRLAGKGIVVVKVNKPNQDMRFDVPVVGVQTLATMADAGATVLAISAGTTLLLKRKEFLAQAEKHFIAVVGMGHGRQ